MLVGIAIIVEFQIVLRRAPRQGIDKITASTLLGWAIGLGILGARVFDVIAYYPEEFLQNPWIMFQFWGGISSFGGMLGGLLGIYIVMLQRQMSERDMVRFFDCLLFALPFTLAVGRLGCALQHDHIGVSSDHWLAVQFPDGPRFDLGVLEFLYCTLMALVFLVVDRWKVPDGFWVGLFFTLYGPVRFAMDALRITDVRYAGWTPGQYLSVAAFVIGVGVLAWVLRPAARASSA